MIPTVRRACNKDIDLLQKIESRSFVSDFLNQRQMKYHLANPRAIFLVCLLGDAMAGYVLFLKRKNAPCRLYSIAIDADYRGRGYARLLLQAGIEMAVKTGANRFSLEVDSQDQATIRLYESFGFQKQQIMKNYYEDGRDALKMKRD